VVLAALDTGLLEAVGDEISELSRRAPVLLGGGVDPEQAGRLGAAALDADPVRAALSLAVAPQGGG
jgi:hypothetical protein